MTWNTDIAYWNGQHKTITILKGVVEELSSPPYNSLCIAINSFLEKAVELTEERLRVENEKKPGWESYLQSYRIDYEKELLNEELEATEDGA